MHTTKTLLARTLPALLSLCLAVVTAGCIGEVSVDLTLTNSGSTARFLIAEGDAPRVNLSEEVGGAWRTVSFSQATLCLPVCGAAGPVECAMIDQVPPGAFALLGGEEVSVGLGGEAWTVKEEVTGRTCAERTDLSGALRVDLCHSESATDSSGDLLDLPDTSGPVNPENFSGASLLDPLCDTFEFEEDSGSELVADIGVD